MQNQWGRILRWLSLSLAGVIAAGSAVAEEQPLKVEDVTRELAPDRRDDTTREVSLEEAEEAAHSEYWIGVQLGEVPEIAKAQLKLEHGLATIAVMPDSPALMAGIKQHDILLRVGEKNLRDPLELVRAVNDAKEQKVKLTFLRSGKEQSIELQPAKRPKPAVGDEPVARVMALTDGEGGPELAQLERALRALQGAAPNDDRLGLWFVRPPIWASPEVRAILKVAEFPQDVQVTIQKKGSEQATVVVKRGDKTWDTTEDKLDALPEDLREPVGRLLGKCQVSVRATVLHGREPHVDIVPATPGAPHATPYVLPKGVLAPVPVLPHGYQQVERRVMVVDSQGKPADDRGVAAKLDQILQKLERLGGERGTKSPAAGANEPKKTDNRFDDLQREIQRLRKDVDRLQQGTKPNP